MDKKQFEAKKAIIDKHRGIVDELMANIEKEYGESQLAEAEQSELEHGDYGMDWIVLNRCDTLEWFGDRKGVGQPASLALIGGPRIGNIFDDLKAVPKPLKEFELSETYISGCIEDDYIWLKDRDERSYLPFAKVRELISYLRRLLHTAEQEQNAKP